MDELKITIPSTPNGSSLWFPSEANDFVLRWTKQQSESCMSKELLAKFTEPNKVVEDEIKLLFSGVDQKEICARALISRCAKKKLFSASLRLSGDSKSPSHNVPPPIFLNRKFWSIKPGLRTDSPYVFSPDAVGDFVIKELGLFETDQPNPIPTVGLFENKELSPVKSHPEGLIVIAGGTGTGKSVYARSVVLRWAIRLANLKYKKLSASKKCKFVPPHIVSFEDPIESWEAMTNRRSKPHLLNGQNPKISDSDLSLGVRLTSRAKDHDVENIEAAYRHSLRQKPSVVYIGECREKMDWLKALELGGTGHLVVTTCHSSTLIDTFTKLAGESQKDSQARRILASNLLAVIHLRQHEVPWNGVANFKPNQTFFSMWRRSLESISNFVVDGLSSIVPNGKSVLSRQKMAKEILELQKNGYDEKENNSKVAEKLEGQFGECIEAAKKMDMLGL